VKKIVILVSDHCLLSGVAGPMDMFLQTGVIWNSILAQEPTPYFDVKITSLDGKPVSAYNKMPVVPHCSIEAVEEADLVIVPSQGFHFNQDDAFHQRVKYLKLWYERGADLASICTGAFTLAATGLLDGKTATTHWGAAQAFRKLYPAVDLQVNKMVTDEGRLFCGGGITRGSKSVTLLNRKILRSRSRPTEFSLYLGRSRSHHPITFRGFSIRKKSSGSRNIKRPGVDRK